MKTQPKFAAALASAALVCGCGSSGDSTEMDDLFCLLILPLPCESSFDRSKALTTTPIDGARAPFTSWNELQHDRSTVVNGVGASIAYRTTADGAIAAVTSARGEYTGSVVWYDRNGNPASNFSIGSPIAYFNPPSDPDNLTAAGQPGIDVARGSVANSERVSTPFTSQNPSENLGLIANPYDLGWNYQSFGVWNQSSTDTGNAGATSFGAATPVSSVPTNGAATYTVKLSGLYISPSGQGSIATADLTVNVDFSARSLSFSAHDTSITRDLSTATAAPNLNLSGTLTYSPGSNSFTGTLVNAGRTMSSSFKGQFYGPEAQELGGVFILKSSTSVESQTGAFGAKR